MEKSGGHVPTGNGTALAIPLLVGTLEKHPNGIPLRNSPGRMGIQGCGATPLARVVESARNKPKLRTCGHPVSRNSSKHHPLQGLRRFGKGALMYADPRTGPTTTRRETRSERRWVPKSQIPGDDKWRGSSPKNAVVRSRSGLGRRDAEPPVERIVPVPGIHRGLDYNPRSPRSELRGVY